MTPRLAAHAALLAAATCLASCAVGPHFRLPPIPTAKSYLAPQEITGPASPAATVSRSAANADPQHFEWGADPSPQWWTRFDCPGLDVLVAAALNRNPTLAAANARVREAWELVSAQNGRRYPHVDFLGGAGRKKYGKEFLGSLKEPPFSYTAAGAAVSYTLDYTGGIARSVRQRRELAQLQQYEADAAYLTLTGSVVTQVVRAAAARSELHAVAQLLTEDHRNLSLVRSAFRDGSVSRIDVVAAETQLADDETRLPPLRQQLDSAGHALAVLTGRSPARGLPQELSLARLTLPRRIPLTLPSALLRHRPDILAAGARLHAATDAVGVATANLYPHVVLTATGGWQSLAGQVLFGRSNAAWSLISGITAPLFDGGTLRAERRASLDELRATAADYREVVLQAFGQVADALDAFQHDSELIVAQTGALRASHSNLQLARDSYEAGNSGILRVLDAQRRHSSALLGLLQAQARQLHDTTQLILALGGGALQETPWANPHRTPAPRSRS